MRAVDLFCGLGGSTAGYLAAGLDIVLAVDGWDVACEAHRRWHPSVPVHHGRVEDAHTLGVRAEFVHASPSCKPYSSANRSPKRGMRHPEYYPLAMLVSQAFDGFGARWLVIENVGGLLWSREGVEEIARFRAGCERRRMPYTINVINSNSLGVAQIRRRVFLVVGPTHVRIGNGSDFVPPVGVEEPLFTHAPDAITHAPQGSQRARSGVTAKNAPGGWMPDYREYRYAADSVTAHDGKGAGWPGQNGRPRVTAPSVRARDDSGLHSDEIARLGGNGDGRRCVAPTVEAGETLGRHRTRAARSVMHSPNGDTKHTAPTIQFVGRTLAECAALQQVPMEILAGFTKRDAHALVGNAIPWRVTEHVARTILAAEFQQPKERT